MLREITAARKSDGSYERHWYQDDLFDLYVWLDADGSIVHFQLAYDKPTIEKALDWKPDGGFMHYRVDEYSDRGVGSMTPLLILDPDFPKRRIVQQFDESASAIDIGVASFVSRMLRRAPSVFYRNTTIKWAAAGIAGALFLLWRILR